LIAAAALMIGASAACSSGDSSAKREPGTLPPGGAQLTIDGKDVPTTAVSCAPAEEYLTTITTGNDTSGATVMVSNAGKLTVEFVRIRNLNGYTLDYNRGLAGGDATAALTETTYQFSGSGYGYGPDSPEPTTAPFTLKVAC